MNISQRIYNKAIASLKIFPYFLFRSLDEIFDRLSLQNDSPPSVIERLQEIGCSSTSHMNRNLLAHFQGTYRLLKKWGNQESVCLAGLCHALYGTETFTTSLVSLEKRQDIVALIGEEAEKLAYYYSICIRKHLIDNFGDRDFFKIDSRLDGAIVSITELEFRQLAEIFLADRLEQIFSLNYRDRYQYKSFFLKAKSYLSKLALQEFLLAYNARD